MSEILKFPNVENNEVDMTNEIIKKNENYLNNIKDKMEIEYNALVRTGNTQAIELGSTIAMIVNDIINTIHSTLTANSKLNGKVHAPYFINQCMQSVSAILAGGVISPITGDDEEWVDITVESDIGNDFVANYRGKDISIKIESVQINKRYPKIYRFNNDNNFAHRIDFFQFHDATNPERVHLTEDSIRFIRFPYMMQALHSHCIVSDNTITDYLDFDYNDIKNGLVYPDQSTDDPNAYVVAPKIPFDMLVEGEVDSEIEEYLASINTMNPESFNDENANWDEPDEE